MIGTWQAMLDGRDAVLQVLPTTFNWPLFWVAVLLMASPALHQVAFLPTKESVFRRLRRPSASSRVPSSWQMRPASPTSVQPGPSPTGTVATSVSAAARTRAAIS
jgi:hypothetical protein